MRPKQNTQTKNPPRKTKKGARALDVGSGSGYLAAAMALLVAPGGAVLGVEKVPELAARSRASVAAAVPGLLAPEVEARERRRSGGGDGGDGDGDGDAAEAPAGEGGGGGGVLEIIHGNALGGEQGALFLCLRHEHHPTSHRQSTDSASKPTAAAATNKTTKLQHKTQNNPQTTQNTNTIPKTSCPARAPLTRSTSAPPPTSCTPRWSTRSRRAGASSCRSGRATRARLAAPGC